MKTPLYCLPPISNFVHPPPSFPVASNPHPHSSFCCLVSLAEWVIAPHLMCYFTFLMILWNLHIMSGLGTLVSERPWCVFYATKHQVYWGLTHCRYSDLTSHKHIHTRHTVHSGASRLTHPYKYIFTPPATCSQQLPLLHWMNNSPIPKIYFPQCLFFSKIIHL